MLKLLHLPLVKLLEASFLGRLLLVLLDLREYGLLVNEESLYDHGLEDREERRDEVVIAEACGVVVEEEKQHDGHEVHHPLHAWHGRGVL